MFTTFTVDWWVVGWCGEVKNRANLSQVRLKLRLSLAIPALKHTNLRKIYDKLGLNWAKLSSNWNWDLLHYINDYKLPLHVTEHNKSVTLVTSTYWHTSLLNCYLPCLLVYLLSYKPHYIEHQTVLQ